MKFRSPGILTTAALMTVFVFSASGCAGNSNSSSKPAEAVEAQPADSETAQTNEATEETAPDDKNVKVANPASTHCVKNGGKLEIMDGEGGQFGVCIFEDGSRCEEWSFLRKKCSPGDCREADGMCDPEKK